MDTKNERGAGKFHRAESGPRARPPWDECSVEDKLERLRDSIRGLPVALSRIYTEQGTMRRVLDLHQHGADGMAVIPTNLAMEYSGGLLAGASYDPLA